MSKMFKSIQFLVLSCILVVGLTGGSFSEEGSKGYLGIYIYENIEGYHTISSTSGTELTNVFLPVFNKVIAFDRVPLQSNETVRILEEMTEGRKVAVTALSTWLTGGVIATPTITFADDDIKFKDLTWHIDQEAVLADAMEKGMTHTLIGSITGLVKSVKNEKASGGGRLISVSAIADLKLMDITKGTVTWAKTYRDVKAGFDFRTAFDAAVLAISEDSSKDLLKILSK